MLSSKTDVAILERVIDPRRGGLSREAAQELLKLDFDEADHARMTKLSLKAQNGKLSPTERRELESYIDINYLIAFIQSKARMSLKPKHRRTQV